MTVQATVNTFDATTGAGTVLLDDGRQLAVPAGALEGGGLRLLRPGQRVHLALDGDGTVAAVRLTATGQG